MNTLRCVGTLILTVCLTSGCRDAGSPKVAPNSGATCPVQANTSQPGATCPVQGAGEAAEQTLFNLIEGTVVQTLSAGRYVYVEVNTGTGTVWVAAPDEPVAKGDKVVCKPQTLMQNFESPSLKRTFDSVYFVGSLKSPASAGGMPANHPPVGAMPSGHGSTPAAPAMDIKVDVAKADGGVTIAELSAQREKLAGTEVLIRAKVVKFNANILGANWLRVKDNSDKKDLAVTTKAEVAVGDTVVVRGRPERDVDLGSGYKYDLIIRNAEVTVDKSGQP